MKIGKILLVIILFLLMLGGCAVEKAAPVVQTDSDKSMISTKQFSKGGVIGEYPFVSSGGSKSQITSWNQIIKKDFNKIVNLYSFQSIPGPAPGPSEVPPVILTIKYETRLNDKILSFLYLADFNASFTAHPTQLTYTTNIQKKNNQRILLGDIVQLNEDFVKDFRTWDFISAEPSNQELNQAIKDYFKEMSDEDILKGLKHADIIGSGNQLDVFSYMTPTGLGLSFGVPNYLGDHVEFERAYDKIKKFIKEPMELP